MKLILTCLICALLLFTQPLSAQTKGFVIPDSLKQLEFKELNQKYIFYFEKPEVAQVYAHTILKKGEMKKDIYMIADGYFKLGFLERDNALKLELYNQSIQVSSNKNLKKYPTKPHVLIGEFYYENHQYENALQQYLLALQHAEKEHDSDMIFYIKRNIGTLKLDVSEYDEALKLFSDCKTYYEQNFDKKNINLLINSVFGISSTHLKQGKLDSCQYYNKMGIALSQKHNNTHFVNYFWLNNYATDFRNHQYSKAIKGIEKLTSFLKENEDMTNLAIAYYFIGASYYKTGQKEKGISYLIKMDSIYQAKPYILYDERLGYDILIEYYGTSKDYKNQLLFVQKTIKIDSFQFSQDKRLRRELNIKYDTPQLISEKEVLIQKLEKKSHQYFILIVISIVILIYALIHIVITVQRNRTYKLKYNELIDQIKDQAPKQPQVLPLPNVKSISNDTFEVIKYKLEQFEINKSFRSRNINLNTLAREFHTNTSYLSTYFNQVINISFPNYLNELRIQDAIHTLKEDSKIRKYTIKALSEYFGFNNAETFSKEFLKKTGIYPSFYIKELNIRENI